MKDMYSQTYREIKEELKYLAEKKSQYGWTQKDADRYKFLSKYIED
jgi:hypothetical protein